MQEERVGTLLVSFDIDYSPLTFSFIISSYITLLSISVFIYDYEGRR